MPSPTRDERHKAEPSLQAGVFLGYRLGPGGLWQGDYIVAPLEQYEGIPLHARTEASAFKNVHPHVTRTVEWSPHGIHFPLFRKYVMENDTLQGIEECKIMIRRERARRKRLKKPNEYRIVDELSEKLDHKGNINKKIMEWMKETDPIEGALTPERELSDSKEEDGHKLIGKRVIIKDLTRRTKHNALLDCELLREVYINLLDVKEPKFNLINSSTDRNISLSKDYNKKIIPITEAEIKKHKEFLKSELKKNFY